MSWTGIADDLVQRQYQLLVIDGVHSYLAKALKIGVAGGAGEIPGVVLSLDRGEASLFCHLTAEGAREVAKTLLAAAAQAEAAGAAKVSAALGAIQSKDRS